MEVVLIRVTESGEQQPVPLNRERTLIGRLDDCHIRIPIADVSRKHCELVVSDGSIVIRDLGSSNGTYVNQERVSDMPLSAGDLVSVGGLVFVVAVNGEPSDINAEIMFEDGLPDEPAEMPSAGTAPSTPAAIPAQHKVPASNLNEDSSMMDFDFNFDDDDDQPPL